ncbi:hypothetical protein GM418_09985 [Maribellus comscasis]|uniref:DUF3300 domain-containing protein n=1 Tax=Maribellus comscasis TaxID=2681766 RepID=A0A6I6JXW3_9BACT|nr:hypothetical protein [Maribellus comscasis]QGY43973.1 hypothetical protein GM418_09985 [Maribellus comscasis]
MKKLIFISILAILTSFAGYTTASNYQDEYLGLPGDNLNLYATMKLFQESETLEGFERSLNDQNSHINNLDLNGDNFVDYISVMDYVDGDFHTIVLRTQLNRNETQDIAVFTVQRFEDGTARIQLIGDEALYGPNYIVEPIYADSQETPNPGYMGGTVVVTTPTPVTVTTYQVATWPIIRFIFRPGYVCWHSAWRWGYYPSYWNPWRPYYWHTYYGYHSHFNHYYHSHYRYWNHHRYHRYHDFYYSRVRSYSPKVNVRIKQGNYRATYSRPDLRKRGDDLYRTAARRSTGVNKSNSGRTNNLKSARNTSNYNSNSGRRTVSGVSSQTRTRSQASRGVENTRKSSTIRSGSSSTNTARGNKSAVTQRSGTRSTSVDRIGTRTSANKKTGVQQKSSTIRNNRTSGSASARQSYRQPNRSSGYSNKSATKPKVSSRSSNSGSSYRQPKVSSRSSASKSVSRSKVSSGSRNSSVSSRSSRNSGSRSSGVSAKSKSSQSRSSSGGRSGRR